MPHPLCTDPNAVLSGRVQELRSKLRRCFKAALAKLAGDPQATMWWTLLGYHRYLYVRRRIRIVGWPAKIRFTNLSNLRKANIVKLQDLWEREKLYFEHVGDDDFYKNSTNPEAVAPANEYDMGKPFAGRNDIKKSRFDHETGQPISKTRKLRTKGAITPKQVLLAPGTALHKYYTRSRAAASSQAK